MPVVKNYPFNSRHRFVDEMGRLSDQAVRLLQANLPNFADSVTPTGVIDGANKVFVLPVAPFPVDSLRVRKRGSAATSWTLFAKITGYTLSGATITFITAPAVGDVIECDFRFLSPP